MIEMNKKIPKQGDYVQVFRESGVVIGIVSVLFDTVPESFQINYISNGENKGLIIFQTDPFFIVKKNESSFSFLNNWIRNSLIVFCCLFFGAVFSNWRTGCQVIAFFLTKRF